jgi:MFS family permease
VVIAASIGTALALMLFGIARLPAIALLASILAGASWIAVLANLNVSAQMALPDWVRGRGLAIFVTVFYGAMTLGSALWGEVADFAGLTWTLMLAAVGALLAIPLTRRWKLQTGAGVDLTPSMHWPVPIVTHEIESDRGPVLVTVEYRLANQQNRSAFLIAMARLAHERRRDGAYAWDLFEDTADKAVFVESFRVESWIEHLRQHQRVTHADRVLQEQIHGLLAHPSAVRHLVKAM